MYISPLVLSLPLLHTEEELLCHVTLRLTKIGTLCRKERVSKFTYATKFLGVNRTRTIAVKHVEEHGDILRSEVRKLRRAQRSSEF